MSDFARRTYVASICVLSVPMSTFSRESTLFTLYLGLEVYARPVPSNAFELAVQGRTPDLVINRRHA